MESENKIFDLTIVGGGIFGLWVAKHAVDQGLSVLVAEKARIGAGASGGLLGALMPYLPSGWKEKKQFQFEALCELPSAISELEDTTGLSAGYGRIGRLMPLRKEVFVGITRQREIDARTVWRQPTGSFEFLTGCDQRFAGWLSKEHAPYGYALDTLGARVNPRQYLKVLAAYLKERAVIGEGLNFTGFQNGVAWFDDGHKKIKTKAIVLAQGYRTFSYLQNAYNYDVGLGIKGQAARFSLADTEGLPVIYDDGVYVVPHDNGTCAVGSTSQRIWETPDKPDMEEDGFINKAFALCPRLEDAPLIDRWAGVRPKCHEREPIIGQLFEGQDVYVATGGFKVSFGIAHRIGEALVDQIIGRKSRITLPEAFGVKYHVTAANGRQAARV